MTTVGQSREGGYLQKVLADSYWPHVSGPPRKVVAALPGTLAEIADRTQYPVAQVIRLILHARGMGVPIVAVEDGISRAVTRYVDRDNPVVSTTVYTLKGNQ